jgi:hypothetical protein
MAVATLILRVLLSAILARASLHKWRAHAQFAGQMRAYRLLPDPLIAPIAFALAAMETVTAIALLNPDWSVPALIAAALFALYGVAMAINLVRGRTDVDCGCVGPLGARSTIDWTLVARNAALVVVALSIAFSDAVPIGPHWLIVLPASATALLLYASIEQAIANRQRVVAWRTSWKH